MRISCVIVSYNNGSLLNEAIMSVIGQTRPPDEIVIADDCSSDGSRELIQTLSGEYPSIKPILREKNLGVSINRDLAVLEATGDLVTYLDGDDYFLPRKIEAEANALDGNPEAIAYSDVRLIDRRSNRFVRVSLSEFENFEASDRIRSLLTRNGQPPRDMLISKGAHFRIGGFNHRLRTYEDWDYTLRLAALPMSWVYSGVEGTAHQQGGGLSHQSATSHIRDELRVLRLNQKIARRHAGMPVLLMTAGRTILSRSKWGIFNWGKRRMGREIPPPGGIG